MALSAELHRPRVTVLFVQFDRLKYPKSLTRLLGVLSKLEIELRVIVIDNGRPGDWSHQVSSQLTHIGGDNRDWEFSGFERGLRWAMATDRSEPVAERDTARPIDWDSLVDQSEVEGSSDLFLFATDALLAYGDDFLDLIDDRLLHQALQLSACFGWVDSFMQSCRILDFEYESWLRTSLFFVPAGLLRQLSPFAWPLDPAAFFSEDPRQPFLDNAPISGNLKVLLRRWLIADDHESSAGSDDDRDGWHSQFELDRETFPLFKNKVMAILREQLLSARLLKYGIPCFDMRAYRSALGSPNGASALVGESGRDWQWLKWREQARELESNRQKKGAGVFVMPLGEDRASNRRIARFFVAEVLPLVLQRHRDVRGLLLTPGAPVVEADLLGVPKVQVADLGNPRALAGASALLLPPTMDAVPDQLIAAAREQNIPVVGLGRGTGDGAFEGTDFEAREAWEFASVCCRLMDGP